MATLIFDIATVGQEWDELSEVSQDVLTRWHDEAEARERLGLSPITGSICALGVYDLERKQSSVYVVAEEDDTVEYRARSERQLLEDFWEGARSYDVFVSFGGRRFDIPYILHRTLVHDLRPTVSLPTSRYLEKQTVPYHVDLKDQFSRYGDMSSLITLHLLCESLGIPSPDTGGVTGKDVGTLFADGEFTELAAYTECNVLASAELYDLFITKLAPPQFLNTLMG